ncbi:nucleoporin NSP1-like [Hypomesus transpacificus]|uniref:nucleoporin NSP1-like n=1 Tax=Hypomesus transpacificus TaxID=137520 RepID=UPI001F0873D2|nr:nucleoporin NSP1-like [Hypomesus transpacificus]
MTPGATTTAAAGGSTMTPGATTTAAAGGSTMTPGATTTAAAGGSTMTPGATTTAAAGGSTMTPGATTTAAAGGSTMTPGATTTAAAGGSTMTPGATTTAAAGGSTMTPGATTTAAAGGSTMTPGATTTAAAGGSTMTPGATTTAAAGGSTMTPGATTTAAAGGSTMTPGATTTTAAGGSTMTPGATTTAAAGGSTMTPGATTTAATGGSTTIQTTTLFVSNNIVETFTSNITRDSCGKTQFCASEPSTCIPSSQSCFFVSAAQSSGQVFSFQLNGPSTSYIAMGLATSAAQSLNVPTYVCANSNGTFKFFTTFLNNNELVMTSLPVNEVKGVVRGKLLQCAFTASLPRASGVSSKSPDTSFIVSMSEGTLTEGMLNTPTARLRSTEAVDLSNPNSTITNSLTATTTAPATTASHGITLQRSLSQALLILLGVLGLTML